MKQYEAYKETGVKWIPVIPTNWNICPLKRICSMKSGNNITSYEIEKKGLYPVFGANGQRGFYDRYNSDGEFLLIGRQGALAGNVHYFKGKFWATDHALVSKFFNGNISYLYYALVSMNLNQYAHGTAAQPGLAASKILSLYIPFPPLAEQEKIVSFLESKTLKIDIYVAERESYNCLTTLRSQK